MYLQVDGHLNKFIKCDLHKRVLNNNNENKMRCEVLKYFITTILLNIAGNAI